jgi:hypothetical protein
MEDQGQTSTEELASFVKSGYDVVLVNTILHIQCMCHGIMLLDVASRLNWTILAKSLLGNNIPSLSSPYYHDKALSHAITTTANSKQAAMIFQLLDAFRIPHYHISQVMTRQNLPSLDLFLINSADLRNLKGQLNQRGISTGNELIAALF